VTDKQPDKGRYDWEDGDVVVEGGKPPRADDPNQPPKAADVSHERK
jgi:hypothetical protein